LCLRMCTIFRHYPSVCGDNKKSENLIMQCSDKSRKEGK
jgi:hypothetical protein